MTIADFGTFDKHGRAVKPLRFIARRSSDGFVVCAGGLPLHVLLREISYYTSAQLFLGLFSDATQAEAARQAYLQSVATDDPWRLQAYRTARLPDDVVIHQVQDFRVSAGEAEVLLVVAHFEGFGQSFDRYEAVFSLSDRAAASRYVAAREAEEAESCERAPNVCEYAVKTVVVNRREPSPPAPERSVP
jgi:hypothetical protein